jgi:hypothetical protein
MAKRKMTKHWEEIKSQYVNALCFSKENGLYTRVVSDNEQADDIIYRPQGYFGYVTDEIDIPEGDFRIQIDSNFGYGSLAYLSASLSYKGKVVLEFDTEKLYVLRHSSVSYLSLPLYDWNSLFESLISAYKQALTGHYQTSSIAYIEEIGDMLDQKEIMVRKTFEKEDPTKWEGDFLITLHAGRKLKDLLEGFDQAAQIDGIITKYLLNLCRKFVLKVTSLSLDLDDIRTSQLSECLIPVHQFMCKNKAGAEYLGMILRINS